MKELIAQVEKEPVPLEFDFDGKKYRGEAIPITQACSNGICLAHDITLNDHYLGILHKMKSGWKMDEESNKKLVNTIGEGIANWYK